MPRAADELNDILQSIQDALAKFEKQRRNIQRVGKKLRKSVASISDPDTRKEIEAELEDLSDYLDEVLLGDGVRW